MANKEVSTKSPRGKQGSKKSKADDKDLYYESIFSFLWDLMGMDDTEGFMVNMGGIILATIAFVLTLIDIQYMVAFILIIVMGADFGMIIGFGYWYNWWSANNAKKAQMKKKGLEFKGDDAAIMIRDSVYRGLFGAIALGLFVTVLFFLREPIELWYMGPANIRAYRYSGL